MPQIVDRAILRRQRHVKIVAIMYFPEFDDEKHTPHGNLSARYGEQLGNPHLSNDKEPYKTVKYLDGNVQEEWDYEYEGRAGNRFFSEIGKLVVGGWQLVSVSESVNREE